MPKKKEKIQIEKRKKRDSMTNHLSTTISFPEPSPSIVEGGKKMENNLKNKIKKNCPNLKN